MIATCWNHSSLLLLPSGIGRPSGARKSIELDLLGAEAQARDPDAQAEHAEQTLVSLARDLGLVDLLERQHARVELERAVEVGDRDRDALDPLDVRPGAAREQGREHERGGEDQGVEGERQAQAGHRGCPPPAQARWSPRRRPQA